MAKYIKVTDLKNSKLIFPGFPSELQKEEIEKLSFEDDKAIKLLSWLTENFFQRRTNGFAKRDDENPPEWQRLYTIHELKELYLQSLNQ